ncbi:protein transport protein Sec61 subunit alpha-like [Lolium rigidum]|uniref:protein transport protein Sec61 subunit alpha-like n=1 Tax=Lolium rigidum TaxID=89674 RepID=UPI001F5DF58E|nr:protein transport protein Sec61 subunit alpha-like [Lolium rigidum]
MVCPLMAKLGSCPISLLIANRGFLIIITTPPSLVDILSNLFLASFRVVFMLSACAVFSKTCIEFSVSSANDVSKQLETSHGSIPLVSSHLLRFPNDLTHDMYNNY